MENLNEEVNLSLVSFLILLSYAKQLYKRHLLLVDQFPTLLIRSVRLFDLYLWSAYIVELKMYHQVDISDLYTYSDVKSISNLFIIIIICGIFPFVYPPPFPRPPPLKNILLFARPLISISIYTLPEEEGLILLAAAAPGPEIQHTRFQFSVLCFETLGYFFN